METEEKAGGSSAGTQRIIIGGVGITKGYPCDFESQCNFPQSSFPRVGCNIREINSLNQNQGLGKKL